MSTNIIIPSNVKDRQKLKALALRLQILQSRLELVAVEVSIS